MGISVHRLSREPSSAPSEGRWNLLAPVTCSLLGSSIQHLWAGDHRWGDPHPASLAGNAHGLWGGGVIPVLQVELAVHAPCFSKIWDRLATWNWGWDYFKDRWTHPVGIPWRVKSAFQLLPPAKVAGSVWTWLSILGSLLSRTSVTTQGAQHRPPSAPSRGARVSACDDTFPTVAFSIVRGLLTVSLESVCVTAVAVQMRCCSVNAKPFRKGRNHTQMKCEKGCG